jgi:hypothetical protein
VQVGRRLVGSQENSSGQSLKVVTQYDLLTASQDVSSPAASWKAQYEVSLNRASVAQGSTDYFQYPNTNTDMRFKISRHILFKPPTLP